jgi:hypothetical protein
LGTRRAARSASANVGLALEDMKFSLVGLIGTVLMSTLACSSPPPSSKDAAPPSAWRVVLQGLAPALLCVWGTSSDNVFAVGGPRGNGGASAVLRYDGHVWKDLSGDLAPNHSETFWWAHGTSGRDLWLVGENGRISHYDGSIFTEHASGTRATLYGVWAHAPDDVWAVGGTPEGGPTQPNDVVLHFDGTGWSPSPLPQTLGRAFFKVWGTAADNIYIVGEAATIWHRSGATWALETNPAKRTLTTVAGCGPQEVYAVGGRDVLRSDGSSWTGVDVTLDNDVSGVACARPNNVVIVGSGGLKARMVDGQWHDDFGAEPYNTELHGAWAAPDGAYWAVGGDYITAPSPGAARLGAVGYYGPLVPSGQFAP